MSDTQNLMYTKITKSSDLGNIQKYVKEILEIRGFVNQTSQDKMLLLIEEIGELAKSIRKSSSLLAIDYNKIQNYDTVESEIADVFIVLLSLCNVVNIDLYQAFLLKEKENIHRTWNKY